MGVITQETSLGRYHLEGFLGSDGCNASKDVDVPYSLGESPRSVVKGIGSVSLVLQTPSEKVFRPQKTTPNTVSECVWSSRVWQKPTIM